MFGDENYIQGIGNSFNINGWNKKSILNEDTKPIDYSLGILFNNLQELKNCADYKAQDKEDLKESCAQGFRTLRNIIGDEVAAGRMQMSDYSKIYEVCKQCRKDKLKGYENE